MNTGYFLDPAKTLTTSSVSLTSSQKGVHVEYLAFCNAVRLDKRFGGDYDQFNWNRSRV